MIDNILSNLKKGAERARLKGEEVAHAARLRVEVFQLNRELDGLYGRLGRSYHAGAEVAVLQDVQTEVRRVEEEIAARERLISELGGDPTTLLTDDAPTAPAPTPHAGQPDPTVPHSDQKLPLQGESGGQGDRAQAVRDGAQHQNTVDQAATMRGHGDPLDK